MTVEELEARKDVVEKQIRDTQKQLTTVNRTTGRRTINDDVFDSYQSTVREYHWLRDQIAAVKSGTPLPEQG